MKLGKCYENYPAWIVLISNLMQILIYVIGASIISLVGIFWLVLYIVYILILEIRMLRGHCVDCYYYGKTCAFGKGKLSSLFFAKGDNKRFPCMRITWKSLIPDFLVSVIPLIAGIVMLVVRFNWIILFLLILLFLLTSIGNGFVRSSLACKFCKQRKLGCPAEKLFSKKK